jgi:hypothetical protein
MSEPKLRLGVTRQSESNLSTDVVSGVNFNIVGNSEEKWEAVGRRNCNRKQWGGGKAVGGSWRGGCRAVGGSGREKGNRRQWGRGRAIGCSVEEGNTTGGSGRGKGNIYILGGNGEREGQ